MGLRSNKYEHAYWRDCMWRGEGGEKERQRVNRKIDVCKLFAYGSVRAIPTYRIYQLYDYEA